MIDLRKKYVVVAIMSIALGLIIRLIGKDIISDDMTIFLLPWFHEIKAAGGFDSLSHQVGNYNLLYQTLLALITYIDWNPVYLMKMLSFIFEIPLFFVVALLTNEILGDKMRRGQELEKNRIIATTMVFCLPTVIMTSCWWGQCDAMYTIFCFLTVIAFRRERYLMAAICMGLGFACKLQTVFIVPFIILWMFLEKKYQILLYVPIVVLSFWSSGIVAFIKGADILSPIFVYTGQVAFDQETYANFPSFWAVISPVYHNFVFWRVVSITSTSLMCVLGYYYARRLDVTERNKNFYLILAWCLWAVLLFLPGMHDRYAYMLDILLVVLCFRYKWCVPMAAVAVGLSTWDYINFLFDCDVRILHPMIGLVYTITYVAFSKRLLSELSLQ